MQTKRGRPCALLYSFSQGKSETLSYCGIHHQCVGIAHNEEASVCTEGQIATNWEEKGCARCNHKFS